MTRSFIIASTAAAALFGSLSGASAMPLGLMGATSETRDHVQNVRLVCDDFGRCWRTGPRRWGPYGDYGPRRYGYGRGYGYGPRYGFNDRPYRRPGVTLQFGL